MPDQDPLIVDVQGIGPVAFPAGTSGAQIESWVINELRKAKVPPQTWGQYLGNMAVRVGGGIAGGVVGSALGPVGTFAGTATGAAMADEWAQSREVEQGVREAVNPLEMLAAGATAPIPGATLKRGAPLLRQVPRALAASVPGAAASSAGLQLAQTGTVDPWRTAMETGRGAGMSTLMGVGIPASIRAAQSPAVQRLLADETGAIGKQPIRVGDLSKRVASGITAPDAVYDPGGGITLDRATVAKMSREQRAQLVRHELAHKVEDEQELWKQGDTALWKLWEADARHPLWDFMRARTNAITPRGHFNNNAAPEIIAELYANDYPKGTFTLNKGERPVPYEWEGEGAGQTQEYPIPPAVMKVLDAIEAKLGIWGKRGARQQ